jgi:hypothetical protein
MRNGMVAIGSIGNKTIQRSITYIEGVSQACRKYFNVITMIVKVFIICQCTVKVRTINMCNEACCGKQLFILLIGDIGPCQPAWPSGVRGLR